MRIDIRGSQELKDVALALSGMDAPLRRYLRALTKSKMVQPWLGEMNKRASTTLEQRVLASTATIATSDQNVRITSANKGRRLSGGLDPRTEYAAIEFGANREKMTSYVRQGHRVKRHTARQLRGRRTSGYVFYPAAREMIPRLASLWVQTVIKGLSNVFEGKAF